MRKHFIWVLAVAAITVSACNNDSSKKEETENQEVIIPNHELISSENMSIIENSDTRLEWDMISRSKIKLEGLTLDKAMKVLAGDNPARVIVEGDRSFPVMVIEYEPADIWESSEEGNKQVVMDSLKKFYDFEIFTEERRMPVLEVLEFDNTLLIAREDKSLGTGSNQAGKIKNFKNYPLKQLFSSLEEEFDMIIEMKFEDKGKYDIELNVVNINKVKETLSTDYGFKFKETEKTIEVIVVKFK